MKVSNYFAIGFSIAFFVHYCYTDNWLSALFCFAALSLGLDLLPHIKAKGKGVEVEAMVKQAEQNLEKSENLVELMTKITAISAHGSSCWGGVPQYHKDKMKELLASSGVSDFESEYEIIERNYSEFHNNQKEQESQ